MSLLRACLGHMRQCVVDNDSAVGVSVGVDVGVCGVQECGVRAPYECGMADRAPTSSSSSPSLARGSSSASSSGRLAGLHARPAGCCSVGGEVTWC